MQYSQLAHTTISRPKRGYIEHYKAIASAVEIPFMLYNVPGRTGVELLGGPNYLVNLGLNLGLEGLGFTYYLGKLKRRANQGLQIWKAGKGGLEGFPSSKRRNPRKAYYSLIPPWEGIGLAN